MKSKTRVFCIGFMFGLIFNYTGIVGFLFGIITGYVLAQKYDINDVIGKERDDTKEETKEETKVEKSINWLKSFIIK